MTLKLKIMISSFIAVLSLLSWNVFADGDKKCSDVGGGHDKVVESRGGPTQDSSVTPAQP